MSIAEGLLRANNGIGRGKNQRSSTEAGRMAGALPVFEGDREDIEFYRDVRERRLAGEKVTTERTDG